MILAYENMVLFGRHRRVKAPGQARPITKELGNVNNFNNHSIQHNIY